MAVARTRSVALVGVTGSPIEVEADVGNGLAGIHLIGLPDTALSEARERVRSAVVNSHFPWPDARITVSLFPASVPKRGSQFDLAIAMSILGAAGVVPADRIAAPFFLGELGLDGRLRPVRGILPSVLSAAKHGDDVMVVVPAANAAEATLVPGVRIVPAPDLRRLADWLRTGDFPPALTEHRVATRPRNPATVPRGPAAASQPSSATASPRSSATATPRGLATPNPATDSPSTVGNQQAAGHPDAATATPRSSATATPRGLATPNPATHSPSTAGNHQTAGHPDAAHQNAAHADAAHAGTAHSSTAYRSTTHPSTTETGTAHPPNDRSPIDHQSPTEQPLHPLTTTIRPGVDLSDVVGQPLARRALEVCAAGNHNLWMLGPPGTGKTLLAERLPTLLPDLELDHALEVTAIHSVAGALPSSSPMVFRPPFISPHHTATTASIVGGGSSMVRPGAVSLAHRGVLFLDEAPEFPAGVLDSLRQPLESGHVTVSRSVGSVTFPARFILVLAANPCPCAQPQDKTGDCQCSPTTRRRYLNRLSGPLLDRIDIKVTVSRSTRRELMADRQFVETSETVAARVRAARARAAERLAGTPWRTNAEIPSSALHSRFRPSDAAMKPMTSYLDAGSLSARGLDRVVRVAWTLADLSGKSRPEEDETSAALALWLGLSP